MHPIYEILFPLIAGFVLDLLVGDPLYLPHPIRWFGSIINISEKKLNRGNNRKLKGLITAALLALITFMLFFLLIEASKASIFLYYPLATLLVYYGLANKNLIDEALKVEQILSNDGLEAGRKQLSNIVGRETNNLSENNIRRAVLETLSENLSDGVIAPLFYYAIGGIPLMFLYKMVNTLDSMIGYKNERYKDFGLVAAKFDDVLNYIPARLTAIIMALSTFSYSALLHTIKYGHQHASPNAGYPEAALSGILNCRFGGPNVYHGKLINKPYIGKTERKLHRSDLFRACSVNFKTAIVFLLLQSIILFLVKSNF